MSPLDRRFNQCFKNCLLLRQFSISMKYVSESRFDEKELELINCSVRSFRRTFTGESIPSLVGYVKHIADVIIPQIMIDSNYWEIREWDSIWQNLFLFFMKIEDIEMLYKMVKVPYALHVFEPFILKSADLIFKLTHPNVKLSPGSSWSDNIFNNQLLANHYAIDVSRQYPFFYGEAFNEIGFQQSFYSVYHELNSDELQLIYQRNLDLIQLHGLSEKFTFLNNLRYNNQPIDCNFQHKLDFEYLIAACYGRKYEFIESCLIRHDTICNSYCERIFWIFIAEKALKINPDFKSIFLKFNHFYFIDTKEDVKQCIESKRESNQKIDLYNLIKFMRKGRSIAEFRDLFGELIKHLRYTDLLMSKVSIELDDVIDVVDLDGFQKFFKNFKRIVSDYPSYFILLKSDNFIDSFSDPKCQPFFENNKKLFRDRYLFGYMIDLLENDRNEMIFKNLILYFGFDKFFCFNLYYINEGNQSLDETVEIDRVNAIYQKVFVAFPIEFLENSPTEIERIFIESNEDFTANFFKNLIYKEEYNLIGKILARITINLSRIKIKIPESLLSRMGIDLLHDNIKSAFEFEFY